MILTQVDGAALPRVLEQVAAALPAAARRCFGRIAASSAARAEGALAEAHRREALALARSFGMGVIAGAPADGFHWDGHALRRESEAYVLLHEVAHFQLAPPARRCRPEFGLGRGSDTGLVAAADAAQRVFGLAREAEEAAASLLGILWECALGHPALASFLDQNWLEGWARGAAAAHFASVCAGLRADGFLDPDFLPTRRLAEAAPGRGEVDVHGEAALIGRGLPAAAPRVEPA